MIPEARLTQLNSQPVQSEGDYVLYWMIANRRSEWNFSLDRALEWCRELGRPLLVFEALRSGYRWANERIHTFIIEGMRDNQSAFEESPVGYYPYLEPEPGKGEGLLKALAEQACLVVTDDFPCFFLPRMVKAAAERCPVRMEMVDSNGIYPMRLAPKTYSRAVDFRRHLQKQLEPHFSDFPRPQPLKDLELPRCAGAPKNILKRWPAARLKETSAADFPIDHEVKAAATQGGPRAARQTLLDFLKRLKNYNEDRNHPQRSATSGLSPYLHFGHVSAHQVFSGIAKREGWNPGYLSLEARGKREGWWGMSEPAEAFMDQLVTWRELGYNMCSREDDYTSWESLPDWAVKTMEEHAGDRREYVYDLEEFENARTHDELWNAAQNQLRTEGHIHNYLRMLWGKKILHWSEHPKQALEIALHLNNKYAVDGRNPNSYSGVYWIFGRYDRAWGPERAIFGKIRYMTSDSTRRKYKVDEYVEHYTKVKVGS